MFARVSHFSEAAELIDESTRLVREQILPQIETIPGFLGVESLADRATGQTMSITYWETEDAMRASEEEANQLREQAAKLGEGEVRSVERYEVVLRVGL
jgi:heme-degrading monooxygenase HmoA